MRLGAAGLALLGGARSPWAAPSAKKKPAAVTAVGIPIGVQLWSVRDACKKDFDGTLKTLAAIGFEGVEFAGYHNYAENPAGLKKKLAELGLRIAGAHLGADALTGEALKKTIDFHKTLGCKNLIVSMDKRATDPEKSKELARLLNDAAKALAPAGLACGYHNHAEEFQKAGDKTYWDLLAERTSKDVILQQDCGWSTAAGQDPAALVRKYPGRTRSTHIKAKLPPTGAEGKKPIIGQDYTDWKKVAAACKEVGGTEWLIVEQEDYPDGLSPVEATRLSYEGLKRLLA